jgi:hypothetical protein
VLYNIIDRHCYRQQAWLFCKMWHLKMLKLIKRSMYTISQQMHCSDCLISYSSYMFRRMYVIISKLSFVSCWVTLRTHKRGLTNNKVKINALCFWYRRVSVIYCKTLIDSLKYNGLWTYNVNIEMFVFTNKKTSEADHNFVRSHMETKY